MTDEAPKPPMPTRQAVRPARTVQPPRPIVRSPSNPRTAQRALFGKPARSDLEPEK